MIQSSIALTPACGKELESHHLTLFDKQYAICRLPQEDPIPPWAPQGPLWVIIRTPEELSILCLEQNVPAGIRCQPGWRAFKVQGPLDFGEIGVLAGLTGVLAAAGIPILAISSFDTDYVLVQENRVEQAVAALQAGGNKVTTTG